MNRALLMSEPRPETVTSSPPEGGYILAQSVLLLVPMLVFAAFATDIGYWYLEGQKAQRAADAAALAAVARLPDDSAAEDEARTVAAFNGFTDATAGDNNDFATGPTPQVEFSRVGPGAVEVRVRREVGSILGRMVLDSIDLERFAVAEYVKPLSLGNPTSALGTGTIPESELGVPADTTWLAVNAYCTDIERGDHLSAGYTNGILDRTYDTCGPAPNALQPGVKANPKHEPDGYVFVVETQPGSGPVDLAIFHPGSGCVEPAGTIEMPDTADVEPRLHYRVYGPNTTHDHRKYLATAAPLAEGLPPSTACIANSPNGDGWYPLATGLTAPSGGGYYYIRVGVRNPFSTDLDPADSFWEERSMNAFSLRATPGGTTRACAYSSANPTCPQLYALDWLPLWRSMESATEQSFYVSEISEALAGTQVMIEAFDVADGAKNIQFEDSNGNSVDFQFQYADRAVNGLNGAEYLNTTLSPIASTCLWQGTAGNPCLITEPFEDFNDHSLRIMIDVPDDYTCGADCWWKVRYVTLAASDRTNWAISALGDPIRLTE